MNLHTYYTLLAVGGLFFALIIGLAVVAIGRGLRKSNWSAWSTSKDVAAYNAQHRAAQAVQEVRRSITEERAVRRLEGESIPSRFDRW